MPPSDMVTAAVVLLVFLVVLGVVAWRERPGTAVYERRRRLSVYPDGAGRQGAGVLGLGSGAQGGGMSGGGMSCGDGGGGGGGC